MFSLRSAWVSMALGLAALCLSTLAHADVVQSPPICLMPGEVGVTGHSGPRCVKKAPSNCPPGWRGALGDHCVVAGCTDGACDENETCVQAEVCIEQKTFNARGSDHTYDDLVGIVGKGAPCDAPRRAEQRGVCVPKGETPTVYVIPAGKQHADTLPRRAGSCGACGTGHQEGSTAAMIALCAGALALSASRRKRRNG